jgi:hypothetical protein
VRSQIRIEAKFELTSALSVTADMAGLAAGRLCSE